MKVKYSIILLLLSLLTECYAQPAQQRTYPITPVPFTAVNVSDAFWGPRLRASTEVTIPLAFSKCEETGRYDNFVRAAHPNDSLKITGFSFDDTDVYKTIEGASYAMQIKEDTALEHYIDSVLSLVASAQEPDGYLYTARTMNPAQPHHWAGDQRWVALEHQSHELYDLGHMIEGAVAHYQATGKTSFLDIAEKYADCAIKAIGEEEDQLTLVSGHQIAEMALAKLYVVTGKERYLDFAKYLLDKRGYTKVREEYNQSHLPVLEQNEAVGHAVRATYMYSGMADIAALTGDTAYAHAIDRIWNNIVSKKIYLTGGIGATRHGEAFGDNYALPNMSAYCETCAAIGNVYLNHRLFLLYGQSKYYDVLERTLYNGLLSGVSLEGNAFFYPNPLQSIGQHERQAWFGCACCPSNICRFIPSVPGYIYAQRDDELFVNLFMSNEATFTINESKVKLTQHTNYPWDGDINIAVTPHKKNTFTLRIRLPGWLQNNVLPSDLYTYNDEVKLDYTLAINGKNIDPLLKDGYLTINRQWKKGDNVKVFFEMKPRSVKAHHLVEADRGRIAIERGPLVYCAEWPDNDFSVLSAVIPKQAEFSTTHYDSLLYGISTIETEAQILSYNTKGKIEVNDIHLKMIPYYAWAHRGRGEMSVWLSQELSSCQATPSPSIASTSSIEASHPTKAISAINDQLTPENQETAPYYHWWPKKNTKEWVIYHFDTLKEISSSSTFWFEDEPWGGCRLPQSWKLYYLNNEKQWEAVASTIPYTSLKGMSNKVVFTPVTTQELH
ncbi:MAG: glycoside hydrolase family 127 protein [Bacteroidales bacterium]|jgi:DUF1680 family protein|nr:glycoside hydrolase family 127 protein [Bacteroidales bacterium]